MTVEEDESNAMGQYLMNGGDAAFTLDIDMVNYLPTYTLLRTSVTKTSQPSQHAHLSNGLMRLFIHPDQGDYRDPLPNPSLQKFLKH